MFLNLKKIGRRGDDCLTYLTRHIHPNCLLKARKRNPLLFCFLNSHNLPESNINSIILIAFYHQKNRMVKRAPDR